MSSQMIKCKDNGIYGIYVVDDINQSDYLIYVGMTTVSFADRFHGHLNKMNDKKVNKKLYNRMRQAKRAGLRVELRPLIQLDKVYWNKKHIYKHELEMMEIAIIDLLKPVCNWEGVEAPYQFGYERYSNE